MEYNGKLFIERLKEVAGNKTQEQISKDINVSASTISRWSEKIPNTDNLLVISEKYNCSIDYLLGIDEKRTQQKTKDLFDVLKDLLICDMQGNVDCDLVFKSLSEDMGELGGYQYGAVLFENRYKLDGIPNNVNYAELFERYSKMKEAFTVIDDEQIKIDMIVSLLKQYNSTFLAVVYDFPFKKKW